MKELPAREEGRAAEQVEPGRERLVVARGLDRDVGRLDEIGRAGLDGRVLRVGLGRDDVGILRAHASRSGWHRPFFVREVIVVFQREEVGGERPRLGGGTIS